MTNKAHLTYAACHYQRTASRLYADARYWRTLGKVARYDRCMMAAAYASHKSRQYLFELIDHG